MKSKSLPEPPPLLQPTLTDQPREGLRNLAHEEEWSVALASQIQAIAKPQRWLEKARQRKTQGSRASEKNHPSESPGDEYLADSQKRDTSCVNSPAPERLQLKVEAGDWGTLDVVVDRRSGEVKVFLAGDRAARNALLSEKQALRASLQRLGLEPQFIKIVSSEQLGIVLAEQPSTEKPEPCSHAQRWQAVEKNGSATTSGEKLNLIG